jgi:hypothetical protein
LKTRKNIAIICCLLWAVLLCFSGALKAEQIREGTQKYSLDLSEELLSGEGPYIPVAWSEPTAPHHAFTAASPVLPPYLITYRITLRLLPHAGLKPTKAMLGFSSLAEQFRILPNAP